MDIKDIIRTIPDYPKEGIMFRDITTLLSHGEGFRKAVDALVDFHRGAAFDCVAGIEARGFILGGAIAHQLGLGFVPVRKKGKLPGETIDQEYALEYGTDKVEIHVDAIKEGDRVLLVDDLIATGGTAGFLEAAGISCERVKKVYEGRPNVVDLMKDGGIQLVLNTTEGSAAVEDSREIRSVALYDKIPYFTTAAGAHAAVMAMKSREEGELVVKSLQG